MSADEWKPQAGEFTTAWIDGITEEERPIRRQTSDGAEPFIGPGEMLAKCNDRFVITKLRHEPKPKQPSRPANQNRDWDRDI